MQNRTSYDIVPYESYPFAQTHPSLLSTIATVLGMRPPDVTKCSVLELGCASGGNLIPIASAFPYSRCLGVDQSSVQIEQAKRTASSLGLNNVRFDNNDIASFPADAGQFDYIICHGVYSWVPEEVQRRILEIAGRHLSINGVAYVSYNTFPGWHLRRMVRDMLRYHSSQFAEVSMRIRQARNFLDFLADTTAEQSTPYSYLLRSELEMFKQSSDSYLFHEHLEDVNEPIYFHEFVDRAARCDLQYLGEADLRMMVPANLPKEVEKVLRMLAHDNIHLEQYMDFVRNRTFRQTLLCRKSNRLNLNPTGRVIEKLFIASHVRPSKDVVDLSEGVTERFSSNTGLALDSIDPVVKAAMVVLSEISPKAMSFQQLSKLTFEKLLPIDRAIREENVSDCLATALLEFAFSASEGIVELSTTESAFVSQISSHPISSQLARQHAVTSNVVCSQRHRVEVLDEFERRLVHEMDGTRHVAEFAQLFSENDINEIVVNYSSKSSRVKCDCDGLPIWLLKVFRSLSDKALVVG